MELNLSIDDCHHLLRALTIADDHDEIDMNIVDDLSIRIRNYMKYMETKLRVEQGIKDCGGLPEYYLNRVAMDKFEWDIDQLSKTGSKELVISRSQLKNIARTSYTFGCYIDAEKDKEFTFRGIKVTVTDED